MDPSSWPIEPRGLLQIAAGIGLFGLLADAILGGRIGRALTRVVQQGSVSPDPSAEPVAETRPEQIVADDAALCRLCRRADRLNNPAMRDALDVVKAQWKIEGPEGATE